MYLDGVDADMSLGLFSDFCASKPMPVSRSYRLHPAQVLSLHPA